MMVYGSSYVPPAIMSRSAISTGGDEFDVDDSLDNKCCSLAMLLGEK